MRNTAFLVMENGVVYEGSFFGVEGEVTGEIVFTTGMTGYIETLTDPSYYGQMVLQTFPLIGNYGIIPSDFESERIGPKAYIVKYPCQEPSNYRSEENLDTFLKKRSVVGLSSIDTRALTKMIRENGVMNGRIQYHPPTELDLHKIRQYKVQDPVSAMSSKTTKTEGSGSLRVALFDFGAKRGMTEALLQRDCTVWTFPHDSLAEDIFQIEPDGIVLSNGPGDPAEPLNQKIVKQIQILQKKGIPILGICLGHQLLAIANGFTTRKLKFGHRGANQPVKDTATGKVYITSQNHGYEVHTDKGSFVNVNDGSCEGLEYGNSFSVQFHPEACGGPLDTMFLFDRFVERMKRNATG